jgi:hypothetical protein
MSQMQKAIRGALGKGWISPTVKPGRMPQRTWDTLVEWAYLRKFGKDGRIRWRRHEDGSYSLPNGWGVDAETGRLRRSGLGKPRMPKR